jgi:glycine/D-amino acid oxidase-like deaminating enzyme
LSETIAIIGGGLQGTLCALACARRGRKVVLFERAAQLLDRASRNNEGKIHRGYTYGLDPSGETQRVMATFGAAFMPALREIVPGIDGILVAREVIYARHQASQLNEGETARHIASVGAFAGGAAPVRLTDEECCARFGPGVTSAFRVAEETISPERLRDAVLAEIKRTPVIVVELNVDVDTIAASEVGVGGVSRGPFAAIVNCAWDGLARLDATAGVADAGLCLRAKAGFVTTARAGLPPAPVTFSYGPFGDVVPLGDDRVYVSWYPACLMGFTTDVSRGAAWFDDRLREFDAGGAYRTTVAAFETLMPGLKLGSTYERLLAGAILARGATDIDDRASGLHRRTAVGIHREGRLFSINPGKLTATPRLALDLASMVAP